MTNAELRVFLEDLNAYGSDAIDALANNQLAEVKTNIKGILDMVRGQLEEIEKN